MVLHQDGAGVHAEIDGRNLPESIAADRDTEATASPTTGIPFGAGAGGTSSSGCSWLVMLTSGTSRHGIWLRDAGCGQRLCGTSAAM